MPKIDHNAFELLGKMIRPPPPPKEVSGRDEFWMPRLTPRQRELWDCYDKYILCHGEKGGAKSIGCLEKLVQHCYENDNALALILVRVRAMATKGGAWDKLTGWVLPQWRDGNRDKQGNLLDKGLGIEFSDVKFDSQHNEFIWIQNQFGRWSMVVLISAPHAHQLRDRIRGYEPSFVFVDELTSCDSIEYFQSVAAQVGRRPWVKGVQQYVAACNPEGPSHWVYKKWFVEAFDEETGEWDKDYKTIHFPIDDNKANLPDGYIDGLKKIYRGDAIEGARMLSGEWVDRPSGEALFREVYNPHIHVYPLDDNLRPIVDEGIMPTKGYPLVLGLDPGSVNNAFAFEQYVPVDGQWKWVIFDEIVTLKRRISYPDFIPVVMRRVKFWREALGVRHEELPQVWISDNSAFNQFRAAGGSFDVLEFQKIYEAHRRKYELEPLGKIKDAPKFSSDGGSKIARVRLLQTAFSHDNIIISARCVKVQQMALQLEAEKQRDGGFDPELALTPRKRSPHGHVFDAVTYPMLLQSVNPTALIPMKDSGQVLISLGG